MRTLSKEQITQVNRDKQRINMGSSKEFPKSMSYTEFVELLKEYGTSRVAKYFGCDKGNNSYDFSIDGSLDLSVILSYWKLVYGESKKVYLPGLLVKMNREFSIFTVQNDPVGECVRERYGLSEDDYNSLSDEDRDRMRKEIEEDKNIIFTKGFIFYTKKD